MQLTAVFQDGSINKMWTDSTNAHSFASWASLSASIILICVDEAPEATIYYCGLANKISTLFNAKK